jgi:hypothetical protein
MGLPERYRKLIPLKQLKVTNNNLMFSSVPPEAKKEES